MYLCVCVCVCVHRERERERGSRTLCFNINVNLPFMTLLHLNNFTNSKIEAFPRFEKLGILRMTSNTRRFAIFGATALHTEGQRSFARTRSRVREDVPPSEVESATVVEPYPENPRIVSTSPNEEFS